MLTDEELDKIYQDAQGSPDQDWHILALRAIYTAAQAEQAALVESLNKQLDDGSDMLSKLQAQYRTEQWLKEEAHSQVSQQAVELAALRAKVERYEKALNSIGTSLPNDQRWQAREARAALTPQPETKGEM